MIAKSLDDFLKVLVSQEKADFEAEGGRIESAWEAVEELLEAAGAGEDE